MRLSRKCNGFFATSTWKTKRRERYTRVRLALMRTLRLLWRLMRFRHALLPEVSHLIALLAAAWNRVANVLVGYRVHIYDILHNSW